MPEAAKTSPLAGPEARTRELTDKVAYAIGKVIARRFVEQDGKTKHLGALGKITAVHTMAQGMTDTLREEALAAVTTVLMHRQLLEGSDEPL